MRPVDDSQGGQRGRPQASGLSLEGLSRWKFSTNHVGGVGAARSAPVKSQPVEFLDSVSDDLRYAYTYYDSWVSGGSLWFRDHFRETVSWIEWNPAMFPKKYRFFRRAIIRRSYFGIYFAIEPDVTTVVAVQDMRDDPDRLKAILHERKKRLTRRQSQRPPSGASALINHSFDYSQRSQSASPVAVAHL